ncbi:hypothetical protein [Branchiibius hedensis]|uniref:hypothetical protein n=1 Tax=Branchiibius hedensis TaxID=672460 RepID=UPI0011B29F06|nr:hypothetical protein [Branchiibius hedensis]
MAVTALAIAASLSMAACSGGSASGSGGNPPSSTTTASTAASAAPTTPSANASLKSELSTSVYAPKSAGTMKSAYEGSFAGADGNAVVTFVDKIGGPHKLVWNDGSGRSVDVSTPPGNSASDSTATITAFPAGTAIAVTWSGATDLVALYDPATGKQIGPTEPNPLKGAYSVSNTPMGVTFSPHGDPNDVSSLLSDGSVVDAVPEVDFAHLSHSNLSAGVSAVLPLVKGKFLAYWQKPNDGTRNYLIVDSSGKQVDSGFACYYSPAGSLAPVSPNGEWFGFGGAAFNIKDLAKSRCLHDVKAGDSTGAVATAISNDGDVYGIVGSGGSVKAFYLAASEPAANAEISDYSDAPSAFLEDGGAVIGAKNFPAVGVYGK